MENKSLVSKLIEASNRILKNSMYGSANFIVSNHLKLSSREILKSKIKNILDKLNEKERDN